MAHRPFRMTTATVITAALTVLATALTGPAMASDVGPSTRGVDRTVPVAPKLSPYVAMGDSYTAAPLVPTMDLSDGCARSSNNYPHVVARKLDLALEDVSCSGADTLDFTQPQTTPAGQVKPQFEALDRRTRLVTVGMGGNDFDVFGTLVAFCPTLRATDPTGAPCRAALQNADGTDRLSISVAQTEVRLTRAVKQIRKRAPRAKILLIGYPQIAPSVGTCPALLPLADGDYQYALEINRLLNTAVERAARKRGARYVDVWGPSQGHDICSDDPWINGKNTDPSRAMSYHPFANEQAAIAGLIAKELRSPRFVMHR